MKISLEKHTIHLLNKNYTVYKPIYDFTQLYVCEIDIDRFVVFGNKNDLLELSKLFKFISEVKDAILYIPSKKSTTKHIKDYWRCNKSYDLVLTYHSLQLNLKLWKIIRNSLKKPSVKTLDIEIQNMNFSKYHEFYFKENKDILIMRSNFETLFLIASKKVFKYIVGDCVNIAKGGEELYNIYPGAHDHAHLDMYFRNKDRINRYPDLTIDYYDEELWGY